ncbi:MAG: polysaccharide biosynthesis/export family protein [Acidobacteriaceae bacterium]
MRSCVVWFTLVLAGAPICCHAQFQGPTPTTSAPSSKNIDESLLQNLLHAPAPELRFRVDDVILVSVYGPGGLGPAQRVQQDGTIRYPFIGTVKVAGLTVDELAAELENQLKSGGIYQSPQVSIETMSQPWAIVTIAGDVQRPGTFPAFGNLTLVQYLSMAGGLQDNLAGSNLATNSSSSSVVTLIRPSLGHPVSIPLGPSPSGSPFAEIPLYAGDEIRVGKVGQVYAVGAFRIQGAYALKNTSPTTVIQLMAQAGGIGFEGERGNTSIIRTEGASQYVIRVNVSRILKGKMADIALEPNDIVFVPTNKMKAAIKGGGTGSIVALADTALLTNR